MGKWGGFIMILLKLLECELFNKGSSGLKV